LAPDNFELPANLLIQDGGWEKQQKFRRKVSEDHIRATFTNPDQLAAQIVSAIRNWEHGGGRREGGDTVEPIDCIILCGGYARRLCPLTLDVSKVTLPVGNKPVLAHVIDCVTKSRFVRNVTLSVNPKFTQQISGFSVGARNTGPTIDIIIESESRPEEKPGPVGAMDFVVSKTEPRDLLVVGGDNLLGFDLEDFQRFAARSEKSANAFFRFPSKEDASEYGVANLGPDDSFFDIQERNTRPSFRDVSTACFIYSIVRTSILGVSIYQAVAIRTALATSSIDCWPRTEPLWGSGSRRTGSTSAPGKSSLPPTAISYWINITAIQLRVPTKLPF
jgi:hypothetical protein